MFDIPSVFPQPMDKIHMKILQRNQEEIETMLDLDVKLCDHLVQNGVFTDSMMKKLMVC